MLQRQEEKADGADLEQRAQEMQPGWAVRSVRAQMAVQQEQRQQELAEKRTQTTWPGA
jgi:hypothetical protein